MSEPARKLEPEVEEDLMTCPLCHGKGRAPRAEASRYLAENVGSEPGGPGPSSGHDRPRAVPGSAGHAGKVRGYPDAEILWRRSPKE